MSASLVGSEMCIRDRISTLPPGCDQQSAAAVELLASSGELLAISSRDPCLLYTSDAADDM
eukprot:6284654-Alexandrium_andersonii.AAC.1